MMELDPHYCDVIVARWEKYTGKSAELIGDAKPIEIKKKKPKAKLKKRGKNGKAK